MEPMVTVRSRWSIARLLVGGHCLADPRLRLEQDDAPPGSGQQARSNQTVGPEPITTASAVPITLVLPLLTVCCPVALGSTAQLIGLPPVTPSTSEVM